MYYLWTFTIYIYYYIFLERYITITLIIYTKYTIYIFLERYITITLTGFYPVKSIYNHLHNILMVEQIFFAPQVKRSVIICNKHCIYGLSHKLPSDLRLRILEN